MGMNRRIRQTWAMVLAAALIFLALPWNVLAAQGQTAVLVTNAGELAVGDRIVIAAQGYDTALSSIQNTNNRAGTAITRNGDTIILSADVQVLTLESGTIAGTFALRAGDVGYLYAASSENDWLRTSLSLTDDASWTIGISSGVAAIQSQGENTHNALRYKAESGLFLCCQEGQTEVCIYKLTDEPAETSAPTETAQETTGAAQETTEETVPSTEEETSTAEQTAPPVQNIAQWSGSYTEEAAQMLWAAGDRYAAGDKLDAGAVLTVVAKGATVSPYYLPGVNGYMGGRNVGSREGDYVQLAFSTAGWGGMTLSFRLRATDAAPGSFCLRYSVDGGATWQDLSTGSYRYSWTQWGKNSDGESVVMDSGVFVGAISDGTARTSMAPGSYISFSFPLPEDAEDRESLLIRLVPGTDRADGKDGSISGNIRLDSVAAAASPLEDETITAWVDLTPDGKEDQPLGACLTMTSEPGAEIFYRVNGGSWQTYDAANKPALDSLPCTVEAYAAMEGKADSVVLLYSYQPGTVAAVRMPSAGIYIEEGGSGAISLSCATQGAQIWYALSADGENYPEFTPYTGPIPVADGFGELYLRAYAVREGFADSEVVTRRFYQRESAEYELYFGQLHSHTDISDGQGTVEDAFAYASQVAGLDFLAVTDHSNSFDNADNGVLSEDGSAVSAEWTQGHAAAEKYTTDSFVGLYGFEMTWSNGLGHMNTFNTPGWQSRTQREYADYATALENYYQTLTTVPGSISQFNHPGGAYGDFSDFAHYSPEYDDLITLIEVGNGEGAVGGAGYFASYEYYTRALDRGWHLAPTNNQDNHKGAWGDANTCRTVVLADELTAEAIYDALSSYRVYATEDSDLRIYYTLEDQVMGSILDPADVGETLTLRVRVSDLTDSGTAKAEVIVNGGLTAAETEFQGGGTVTFQVPSFYSYYYIRITQADGDIAVTAPVWVGQVEKAGISRFSVDTRQSAGDSVGFTLEIYNDEASPLEISSIVYADKESGQILWTDTGITRISPQASAVSAFCHTFSESGSYTITATVTGTLAGQTRTYTRELELSLTVGETPTPISQVLPDGELGDSFVLQGKVAAVTANSLEGQDTFLLWDGTGSIPVIPVPEDVKLGMELRVSGCLEEYQGRCCLRITEYEILDGA